MAQNTDFTGPHRDHLTSAKAATLILRGIIAAGPPPLAGVVDGEQEGQPGGDVDDLPRTDAADNLRGIRSRGANFQSAKREQEADETPEGGEVPVNPSSKKARTK
ncbi:hypothetical protein B0T24DRAFT_239463 [Lasiosphaeria ovina]|uniref:Uncharacterized protein n=1 Tax=Lasiosphaeria ovina TaxID=92902 RepID=A0AAE0KIY9_9PEZI|nr:hypothetical protein B0T24DRAFT_239463 [Lasiosphaeria ovina]